MGSDWAEFCEANGWNPGSEEDYEKFLESMERGHRPGRGSNSGRNKESFDTYEEAVKWAKASPGRVIRRAESGYGFEVKPNSDRKRLTSEEAADWSSFQKLPDRGDVIGSYQNRSSEICRLAPLLHDVLTNSASNARRVVMRPFSQSEWELELRRLSSEQLKRLRLLVMVHLEDSRQHLRRLYAEIARDRRMKAGHYGEALSEKLHVFMERALADIDRVLVGR